MVCINIGRRDRVFQMVNGLNQLSHDSKQYVKAFAFWYQQNMSYIPIVSSRQAYSSFVVYFFSCLSVNDYIVAQYSPKIKIKSKRWDVRHNIFFVSTYKFGLVL